MTRGAWLGVLVLVLSSGCAGMAPGEAPADDNRLGWENGYAWDDSLHVTTTDGLNESEREAVVARAMARLERLRGLEFRERVPTRVITRERYRENRSSDPDPTHAAWNDQVWEALFLVGDDAEVHEVFDEALGSRVLGYYEPGSGEVTIVSETDSPAVARSTLVHELVHALQDQHFGLEGTPDTQDAQLARNAVVEGEANRLQLVYARRCGEEWSCIAGGSAAGGGSLDETARNVFAVIYVPYAIGPDFVETVAGENRTALDDLYSPYPNSTEQVVHPERFRAAAPENVTVPDRSRDPWSRFDHDPVADTVGEASIFAMVVRNDLGENAPQYSYQHPVSDGWAGDSVVPYRDGERYGYVWTTAWDTERDAGEFHAAYEQLMDQQEAEQVGDGQYRLPDDHNFGGAYRLSIDGRRVTVVHGPTRASLDRIHPD
jgi:hypothetical protein